MTEMIKDQPLASHFISVKGSKIHYIDEGEGDPILFLHGIPTSSYLWRNIIPQVKSQGRCIAPDLIGMGKSDKPKIAYRIFDHIDYIQAFIEQLGLKNITLVLHGWGSVIGFHYAMSHPDNVARIAFFESHVRAPSSHDALSLPLQDRLFLLGDASMQHKKVVEGNYFNETFLKRGTLTTLSPAVIRHYQEPFTYVEDRQVLWQYCQDLPTGKEPQDVIALINHYSDYLKKSTVPKLMMYAVPGFITNIETVVWCKEHLSHFTLVDLGDAMHFAQESKPQEFSNALLSWLEKTKPSFVIDF